MVMAGLDPAIQKKARHYKGSPDGRVKPGHDEVDRAMTVRVKPIFHKLIAGGKDNGT